MKKTIFLICFSIVFISSRGLAGTDKPIVSRFGVNLGVEKFSNEMQNAGVEIVREWIVWNEIEPVEDQYNWTRMDDKVKKANSAGIEILGYFISMPSWARKQQEPLKKLNPSQKPSMAKDFWASKDFDDFRQFAKDVAERYDGKHGHGEMKYIEILNEVVLPEFFDFKDPDNPYELWLINGYEGTKEGNPNAKVLIGGFFDPIDSKGNPPGPVVKKFIGKMLGDYARYYDIINFHSYSPTSDGIIVSTQYIKNSMKAFNVNKPMWITETANVISELLSPEQVSKEVIKRYIRAFGEGVEKVFWFPFLSLPTKEEDQVYGSHPKNTGGFGWAFPKNSGLSDKFHVRRSYYTLRLLTKKLSGFSIIEKISDSQYKFMFEDRNPVYVLWNNSKISNLPFDLKGKFKVTDYLGNEQIKSASELELTESPIFVERIAE